MGIVLLALVMGHATLSRAGGLVLAPLPMFSKVLVVCQFMDANARKERNATYPHHSELMHVDASIISVSL